MVTMNGEECHNEWEITFEEIHRNGAIAYAIYNYVNYTGDFSYLGQYGLEVLVEISRFWEERVNYVPAKDQYMMLGVTGPNEYENNVNNNWYTNRIASWTMEYTLDVLEYLKENENARYAELTAKLGLQDVETTKWQDIISKMYYPVDEELGVFLQQDGFLNKELVPVKELDPVHLPLNQNWSWDRILRSVYIKQADVLQGLFFLGDQYDLATKNATSTFMNHSRCMSPPYRLAYTPFSRASLGTRRRRTRCTSVQLAWIWTTTTTIPRTAVIQPAWLEPGCPLCMASAACA